MWSSPGPQTLFKYNSGSGYSNFKEPEDTHAHSPTRHGIRRPETVESQTSSQAVYNAWPFRNLPAHMTRWPGHPVESRWPPQEQLALDGFVDPYMIERRMHGTTRSSGEDVSMPDYTGSSSASSRAMSSMTGVSYEHSRQPSVVPPSEDEHYSQYIETMSPLKAQSSAIPATSPASLKPSAAAEARPTSYPRSANRTPAPAPVVLKEPLQRRMSEVSGPSTKSNVPPESTVEPATARKMHPSPSPSVVKSKKETTDVENKENEADAETPRKDVEKGVSSPAKLAVVRSTGSMSVPRSTRRSRSSSSILGDIAQELANASSKDEISLGLPVDTPAPVLAVDDHIQQSGFEEFLDSGLRAGEATSIE